MIDRLKWFFHPIFIFVFSILALASSLFLYIYWYIEVSAGLKDAVRRYNIDPRHFFEPQTWVVILVLSILVGIILIGILIIFVYSQKMARLNRLQHDFINNFTHELKTPVTSLKLFLETFLKHDLPRQEQNKYIHFMLQDVERLMDNIGRILNLARIETKSHSVDLIPTNLPENIGQFLQNNRHLFGNCDIRIHHETSEPIFCNINPHLFEMLVMNIVINGIKYNDSEKPIIDIRFIRSEKRLHIRFEDNGIGIEKAEIRKIFRKFYQTGKTESVAPRGSGIGLYLVQNIARMHRGKVIAQQRHDVKGSVFTLILPYARKSA